MTSDVTQLGYHEIGIGGFSDGIRMGEPEFQRELRHVRKLIRNEGRNYLLQGSEFSVSAAFEEGRVNVYRINGNIVATCVHEAIDLIHKPFVGSMVQHYRVNELRMLVVAEEYEQSGIAARLVREAQFKGTIESPLMPGPAMRAIATVGCIREDNEIGLRLAGNLSATVCSTECSVIHNHEPLRAYSIMTLERVQERGTEFPFYIVVLRSCDLFQSGQLHLAGANDVATTSFADRFIVNYDAGVRSPSDVRSAAMALALYRSNRDHDPVWIARLGLEDGPNARGLGNAYFGDITPEMVLRLVA